MKVKKEKKKMSTRALRKSEFKNVNKDGEYRSITFCKLIAIIVYRYYKEENVESSDQLYPNWMSGTKKQAIVD